MNSTLFVAVFGFISGLILTIHPVKPSSPTTEPQPLQIRTTESILQASPEGVPRVPSKGFFSLFTRSSDERLQQKTVDTYPTKTTSPTATEPSKQSSRTSVANESSPKRIWRTMPLPNPGNNAVTTISGVHGLSESDAWAVGTRSIPFKENNDGLANSQPFAMHWDGKAWTIQSPPNVHLVGSLNAVHMVSHNNVWAVGSIHTSDDRHSVYPKSTLIEHWDGHSWSIIPSPDGADEPSNPHWSELVALDARGPNNIWAVGNINDTKPLVLRWDGERWAVHESPLYQPRNPASAGKIDDIQIIDDHNIWITAYGNIFRWDGSKWMEMREADANIAYYAITAVNTNDIWIGGNDCNSPTQTMRCAPIFYHWDGNAWNEHPYSLTISKRYGKIVSSMIALNKNDVWAFGTYSDTTDRAYAAHWDGSAWQKTTLPTGKSDGGFIMGAFALSSEHIWAVGYENTIKNRPNYIPLIDRYRNE